MKKRLIMGAIHDAIKNQDMSQFRAILRQSKTPNATSQNIVNELDDEGNSPLLLAAEAHSLSMAETLLERGADINQQNINGDTPLHITVRGGCIGILNILLERGAEINQQNRNGDTPLQLAREYQSDVEKDVQSKKLSYLATHQKSHLENIERQAVNIVWILERKGVLGTAEVVATAAQHSDFIDGAGSLEHGGGTAIASEAALPEAELLEPFPSNSIAPLSAEQSTAPFAAEQLQAEDLPAIDLMNGACWLTAGCVGAAILWLASDFG